MLLEDRADSFLRMIRRADRGRLKIYLGYCPGVGKTYQMLLEGHRLREEGIDVVIGYLETHGRAEIAKLAGGLEVIPRRKSEYRGVPLEEMDLDAVLARKPQVALVDELAHTNVPGSGNAKRYQDIQDILASGIHVITTLNIQHMESLYDTVEKAVHVRVRERLPDSIVAEADQIVNVDVTTEDLLKRLKEGRVYKADRIGAAMGNFFKTSNLEKLRELTLREMASQIDLRRREDVEEPAAAPDQVVVALSSRGPNSEMLLRYASRLAGKLNRNWYAVYVQTPSEEPTVIDAHTQRILSGTLTLAKQLGATVFTYKGEDIPATILRFAKAYRVGTIVVGTPMPKPLWKTLWRKSTVERLIHDAKGFTVVILDTRKEEPSEAKAPEEAPRPPAVEPAAPALPGAPLLGDYVSPRRIVIWDHPVERDVVLRTLAEAAVGDSGEADLNTVLTNIAKREELGSTFLNEGVALPHARIEKLRHPVVAIGLTRKGVSDVSTQKPIEYVFLILSPEESPETQIRILGQVSRASRNRQLVRELDSCRTPEEVLAAIRDWETPGPPTDAVQGSGG
jgi:two-component system sensor histidine kinase KdpD